MKTIEVNKGKFDRVMDGSVSTITLMAEQCKGARSRLTPSPRFGEIQGTLYTSPGYSIGDKCLVTATPPSHLEYTLEWYQRHSTIVTITDIKYRLTRLTRQIKVILTVENGGAFEEHTMACTQVGG